METVVLEPTEVKIKDDLPRFRQEMGNVEALLASMEKFGQIQPVVITRQNELVAGGRRLAACLLGGREVFCAYSDAIDPLTLRELELEENIQRKALTPAEEVMAVKEIHDIKQTKHGVREYNEDTGWSASDTGNLLEKSKSSVLEDLKLAAVVEQFPELSQCKTKAEIRKAARAVIKVSQRTDAMAEYEKKLGQTTDAPPMTMQDALEHMKTIPDHSIDLLLTDPPFGIDINKILIGLGRKTGGASTAGFKFEDDAKQAWYLYQSLAHESLRFVKEDGHAYVFVAPEFYETFRNLFVEAGWKVSIKPIIWIKRTVGQSQMPSYWPASCYEMIMYCRRDNSRLVLEGRPDWIQCDPVQPERKIHPTEKPIDLLKEMIARCVLPGAKVYDPFGGSGASIEAALEMKCFPQYNDKTEEAYNAAVERITKYYKRKEDGKAGKLHTEDTQE